MPATVVQPFDMADVTLDGGPFLHAQRMTEAYLMRLQPDRLLANFRANAGLKPKAPAYGGWESEPEWADINCHGHTLGHYLSACALAYRATKDKRYRQRIDSPVCHGESEMGTSWMEAMKLRAGMGRWRPRRLTTP